MKSKRNALVWMYTVATWLWLGSNSSTVDDTNSLIKEYPTVSFTTDGATANSYRDFINAVRASLLAGGDDERYGIPVLPNRDGLSMNQRFVLIGLTNQAEISITLALDVTNAYLVGYQAGSSAYFFRTDNTDDAQANTYLFTDAQTRQTLNFSGNYDRLEALANQRRENIELGIGPLEEAISTLYFYSLGRTQLSALARSFMIIIQMIPEAVRYNYIEGEMRTRIRHNRRSAPDPSVLTLENRWGRLSTEIQESNQGAFANQVQLQRRNGSPFYVSDVATIISIIALMVFRCAPPRQSSHPQFPLVIRPVVTNFNVDNDVCVDPEPTVRIIGRNGLCVDVKDGKFHDGNAIQLWTCSSHIAVNQFWTLKKDGTIRSNGKCLTTYGYSPGVYVMIYDCDKAEVDATKWQIWTNRTIINPRSGLVLAAKSGNTRTVLTVETNSYASSQGWLPSNTTQPFVTSIVGLNDLCLQANGGSVWLEECSNNNASQQWAFYADGSIRTQQNQDNCLTTDAGASKTIVRISSCSAASSGQRWMFKNDGSIWNLQYELVLDVTGSDPSLKQIIIFPFTGRPNQIWLQVF